MSELLEKLKSSINKEVIFNFDMHLLEQHQFVPIDVKGQDVFVVINSQSEPDKDAIQNYINEVLKGDFAVKIKPVQAVDFQSLYSHAMGVVNPPSEAQPQVSAPVPVPEAKRSRIGQLFIQAGYITERQLVEAVAEGKRLKMPVGSVLHKMGFITLEQLKTILHQQLGFDTVTSEQLRTIPTPDIKDLFPEDFIVSNKVIPLSSNKGILTVGMVHPDDRAVLKEIVYMTGQKPYPMLLTYFEFQSYVEKVYGIILNDSVVADEVAGKLFEYDDEALQAEFDDEESIWEQVEKELQESTGVVVDLAQKIVTRAIDLKASDIHIEPRLTKYVVRYRMDGILKHVMDLPIKADQAIITRFKVLARMNIAEHRRPQDGTFTMEYNNSSYDFRINSLPVGAKEKVVIRILAPAVSLSNIDREINLIGATDRDIDVIKNIISSPNGIILTSGPTGSGKTTTLYSILKNLNDEGVNITTIEDPIEIRLEGINQSQVNPKAGITFASCMRAILRQDPDIILVGEIRDYETLEVAISAALTGHLVLSTVHTNSAAATVTRLIEMGAKDYLVSSTLTGVIAQRLVRRLCPHCKEKYFPTYEEASHILVDDESIKNLTKTEIYKPVGCKICDFTGYKGRLGVYEILPITKEIKKLIAQGAHDIEIEESAVSCGMRTLRQACLAHILEGSTSTEEFVRVLGYANE